MKVILIERVKGLGNVAEIVQVTGGHARNYLIPNKLALPANEGNTRFIEQQQKQLEKKVLAQKQLALDVKKKVDGFVCELVKRVGANGKLFGSVTNAELMKELENRGIEVERRSIIIENPIKQPGEYQVKVKLFVGVEANFQVKVMLDPKQAEEMKKQQEIAIKVKKERAEREAEEAEKAKVAAAEAAVLEAE
jgi:large subunit ribosomal protein L9